MPVRFSQQRVSCVDALALGPQRREGLGNQGNQANCGRTSKYCVASLWHFFRGEVTEPQVGNHGNSAPVCMPVRFSRIRCFSQLSQLSPPAKPGQHRRALCELRNPAWARLGSGHHGNQANSGHTSRIRRILRGRSGAGKMANTVRQFANFASSKGVLARRTTLYHANLVQLAA